MRLPAPAADTASATEQANGGSRPGLDRTTILEAAVELVDREGMAALNMRALAAQLGAGTMSIYHHVPNKDALLDGLTEVLMSEIGVPDASEGSWVDRALHMARSFREVSLRHPHCVPLLVTRTFASDSALTPCEAAFDLLAEGGFDSNRALVIFRTILAYCLGFVTLEAEGFFGALGPDPDADELRSSGMPRLAELVPHLSGRDYSADFEDGLRIVLAGVVSLGGS